MKTLRTLLAALFLMAGTMAINAQCMSLTAVRNNARFLTDRMAYTLGIRDPYLIDEIYRINYDYIWGVNDYLDDVALGYYYDDYINVCAARDMALRTLLGTVVWNRIIRYSYFHRPIAFVNHCWHFSIYDFDRHGRNHYFCAIPRPYHSGYCGGGFFRGMAPRDHRGPARPPVNNRFNHDDHRGYGKAQRHDAPSTPHNDRGNIRNGRGEGSNYGNAHNDRGNNRAQSNIRDNRTPSNTTSRQNHVNVRSENNARSSSRSSATATRVSNSNPSKGVARGGRR